MKYLFSHAGVIALILLSHISLSQTIPLPEHPRPDFERALWQNLNGVWQFEFDSLDQGISKKWNEGSAAFSHKINVPFPWGSQLSGVADKADIAWYKRTITIIPEWKNKRTFLTIGASDWETSVWIDGHFLGTHQGGYTPFSFELTEFIKYGQPQTIVVRADDKRRRSRS
jgi:beta-galactosidase/beta-glucuronidase